MTTKSVALKYESEIDNAPYVLARGIGALGETIIRLAEENDIPVYRNDKLADSLTRLRQNDEIPAELYTIVAEIFRFVYSLGN